MQIAAPCIRLSIQLTLLLVALLNNVANGEINYQSHLMIIPEQAHVLSSIAYAGEEGSNRKYLDVEEFVDRGELRSSLMITDSQDAQSKPVYFVNDLMKVQVISPRRLVKYEQESNKCSRVFVSDFDLIELRLTSIRFTSNPSHKDNDVALGPSSILYLIQSEPNRFKYKRATNLISWLGMKSLLYRAEYVESYNEFYTIDVFVSPGNLYKEPGYNSLLSELRDSLQVIHAEAKREKGHNVFQMFEIDFYLVEPMILSAISEQDESETRSERDYDFERSPFLLPTGIGCFDADNWPDFKRLQLPEVSRFSANLRSNWAGNYYIAFDEDLGMLRLDSGDLETVYDYNRHRAYHTIEQLSVEEISIPDQKDRKREYSRKTNCAVVQIGADQRGYSTWNNPIGLKGAKYGSSQRAPGYMGSAIIDHVHYRVYEQQLDVDFETKIPNIPLALSSGLTRSLSSKTAKYYLTYYFLDLPSQDGNIKLIPHMVDVWEFHPDIGVKFLLNNVEFQDFSWDLDVVPPEQAAGGSESPENPFHIQACADDLGRQLEIRFVLAGAARGTEDKRTMAALTRNQDLVLTKVKDQVCSALSISPVHLAKITMKPIKGSTNIRFEVEAVDMQKPSVIIMKRSLKNMDKLPDDPIEQIRMVASLDACGAEATFRGGTTLTAVYCSVSRLCLLYSLDKMDELKSKSTDIDPSELNDYDDRCNHLEILTYSRYASQSLDAFFDSDGKAAWALKEDPMAIHLPVEGKFPNDKVLYSAKLTNVVARASKVSKSDDNSPLGLRFLGSSESSTTDGNSNSNIQLVSLNSGEALEECRQACRMDRLCNSFSFCGSTSYGVGRCVLSELWLSGERMDALRQQILDQQYEIFHIAFDMADGSLRQYDLRKDEQCRLYKKDVLTVFTHRPINVAARKQMNKEPQKDPDRVAGGGAVPEVEPSQDAITTSSATECAELALEYRAQNVDQDPSLISFLYCPMNLRCELDYKKLDFESLRLDHVAHICNNYTLDQRNMFNMKYGIHIRLEYLESVPDQADHEVPYPEGSSKVLHGLDAMRCARDCALLSSDCLSFDFCSGTEQTRSVCVLYNVRSPASTGQLILLPSETEFRSKYEQKLVNNLYCDHYWLRNLPLQIKVTQMGSPMRSLQLKQRESRLMDIEMGWSHQFENQELQPASRANNPASSGGFGLFTNVLIFGSFMGLVVAFSLYGNQMMVWATDTVYIIRSRLSERHQGPRVSTLDLPNNMSL